MIREAVAGLPALLRPGGRAFFLVADSDQHAAHLLSLERFRTFLPDGWQAEPVPGMEFTDDVRYRIVEVSASNPVDVTSPPADGGPAGPAAAEASARALVDRLGITPGQRVLDIGPGALVDPARLAAERGAQVTVIDERDAALGNTRVAALAHADAITHAKGSLIPERADLRQYRPVNLFAVILMLDVLDQIPTSDRPAAIAKALDWIDEGGIIAFSTRTAEARPAYQRQLVTAVQNRGWRVDEELRSHPQPLITEFDEHSPVTLLRVFKSVPGAPPAAGAAPGQPATKEIEGAVRSDDAAKGDQ